MLQIEHASFAADAFPPRLFRHLYRRCRDLFVVARIGRSVAGYMVTSVEGDRAEVVSIAVDPAHRGRGVGSALMRHTLERLRAAGLKTAALMVRSSDAGATGFYRRFGFRALGRVAGYYEDGAEGLRMQLRL